MSQQNSYIFNPKQIAYELILSFFWNRFRNNCKSIINSFESFEIIWNSKVVFLTSMFGNKRSFSILSILWKDFFKSLLHLFGKGNRISSPRVPLMQLLIQLLSFIQEMLESFSSLLSEAIGVHKKCGIQFPDPSLWIVIVLFIYMRVFSIQVNRNEGCELMECFLRYRWRKM